MLEEPHGCGLKNVPGITNCLEILQERNNRHGILSIDDSVRYLHGSLLGYFLQLIGDVIIVTGDLFGKSLSSIIDRGCKLYVHWSDDC